MYGRVNPLPHKCSALSWTIDDKKLRYCDSRRKVLLAHVHEGYDKDWSVSLSISNTSFNFTCFAFMIASGVSILQVALHRDQLLEVKPWWHPDMKAFSQWIGKIIQLNFWSESQYCLEERLVFKPNHPVILCVMWEPATFSTATCCTFFRRVVLY